MNKRKIFNDPVHGFIAIPGEIVFDLIDHPWFQRLRRIKQLGLTEYVYPGAIHTRFHHALGAMHLMTVALSTLRDKGVYISSEEVQACQIAILLHDIGHGPYSHTLEHCLLAEVKHESISLEFMKRLNREFNNELDRAIEIFEGNYSRKFLHQLVSSQLDTDRLDYLSRDSFFTGVHEGVINYKRIIDMLNVSDEELVVEAKGIYSIEKFLISRRLMYWQVYLHKTVIAVEDMLIKVMERARFLISEGEQLPASDPLAFFLTGNLGMADFRDRPEVLEQFARMDDHDVFMAVKDWQRHSDPVLSMLCTAIVQRQLFRIEIGKSRVDAFRKGEIRRKVQDKFGLSDSETDFIVFEDSTSNHTYSRHSDEIRILMKDGSTQGMREASEQLDIALLQEPVKKYYLVYPKTVDVPAQ